MGRRKRVPAAAAAAEAHALLGINVDACVCETDGVRDIEAVEDLVTDGDGDDVSLPDWLCEGDADWLGVGSKKMKRLTMTEWTVHV